MSKLTKSIPGVRVSDELHAAVVADAQAHGRTVAESVRHYLTRALEQGVVVGVIASNTTFTPSGRADVVAAESKRRCTLRRWFRA